MRYLWPVLLVFLSLAMVVPVAAQFSGSRRGGMGGGGDRDSQSSGNQQGSEATRMSASDRARMQLTDLAVALKLTHEQADSWLAYQRKAQELLSDLSFGMARPDSGETAPKQIERALDLARRRLAMLEGISDAANKLYAGLTIEQKAVADRMIAGTIPVPLVGGSIDSSGDRRPQQR